MLCREFALKHLQCIGRVQLFAFVGKGPCLLDGFLLGSSFDSLRSSALSTMFFPPVSYLIHYMSKANMNCCVTILLPWRIPTQTCLWPQSIPVLLILEMELGVVLYSHCLSLLKCQHPVDTGKYNPLQYSNRIYKLKKITH